MNSLVAYDGSSDEEEANEEENYENVTPGIILPEPINKTGFNTQTTEEKELESVVRPRAWEKAEAPKPPAKKGKIQLILPDLPKAEVEEDEEGKWKNQEKNPPPQEGIKLLSMLPAPKGAPKTDKSAPLMVPSFLKRKQPATGPAAKKPNVVEEDDDEDTEDFFGLDSAPQNEDDTAPEIDYSIQELGPVKPFQPSEENPHPSQQFNMAGPVDERYGYPLVDEPEDTTSSKDSKLKISDEKAANLIYKYDMEMWGFAKPGPSDRPEIRDVSVDTALGPNVRSNLLKTITSRPPDAILMNQKDREEDPGKLAKRKHQITYLAFMAKQREESLKEEWAQNRFSKRQTQQKYGF